MRGDDARRAPGPAHRPKTTGYDFPRALRAVRALMRDPDDTAQVFAIFEALAGRSHEWMMRRLERDPDGRALKATRPDLARRLIDREALRALPDRSLGRAYLDFVEAWNIGPEGLVAASAVGERGRMAPGSFDELFGRRMRDSHDLWHTVTGYGGDVAGEVSLLAFSLPQVRSPGVALVVLAGIVRERDPALVRAAVNAFRRGLAARWLPAAPWEELLEQPLARVRERLGLGVESTDVRPAGLPRAHAR